MTANRYALGDGRELLVSRGGGLLVLGLRDQDDNVVSGPLAICETDVAAFQAAVSKATGAQLAGEEVSP